jgi:PPOX class probable F420-dependent enzyme
VKRGPWPTDRPRRDRSPGIEPGGAGEQTYHRSTRADGVGESATRVADGRTAREVAVELLETTETCTLATATPDGRPEAATVRFVADDGLDVYFNTATSHRKYENVRANPRVAVVVDGERRNLQLEGEATELDGAAEAAFHDRYHEKYGPSDYLTNDRSTCFRVEPDWARLLVDGSFPPEYAMVVGEGPTEYY